MPDVRMPDGTMVRFPDGMPRDQIRSMILKKFPDAEKTAAAPREGTTAGFLRSVAQGVEGAAADIDRVLPFSFAGGDREARRAELERAANAPNDTTLAPLGRFIGGAAPYAVAGPTGVGRFVGSRVGPAVLHMLSHKIGAGRLLNLARQALPAVERGMRRIGGAAGSAGEAIGVPAAAGTRALTRDEEPVSRQEGGPLDQGQPAVVGEDGPELFVPDKPGTVVPTDDIGASMAKHLRGNRDAGPGTNPAQAAIDWRERGGLAGTLGTKPWDEQMAEAIRSGDRQAQLDLLQGFTGSTAGAGKAAAKSAEKILGERFLKNAVRTAYPGIYKRPDVIAREAAAMVAPEDPALKELFGVTREDLYDISQQGRRQGNREPQLAQPKGTPRGSAAAEAVMTPANAQRMVDTLGEAEKYPELTHPMDAWYVMDPAYQRLKARVGEAEAKRLYSRFNTVVPSFSPASNVETEINRGTAANMMIERGQFPRFVKYGGIAQENRGRGFPKELADVQGHMAHSTSQTGPLKKYLETGALQMESPKVPLYGQASGVPETGFQTKLPIPDAHYTRSLGMSDVRTSKNFGESMKMPEYRQVGPWYRENVATPLGIEAVPAQGRQWGVYAPQTGVDTPIGAPKLELLAKRIMQRAQRLGLDPQQVRDAVLMGKEHAVLPLGVSLGALAQAMGAAQDQAGTPGPSQ